MPFALSPQPLTRLEQAAALYLTLPLMLFLAVAVAPALAGLLTAGVVLTVASLITAKAPLGLPSGWPITSAVALLCGLLGGATQGVYASPSWHLYDSIITDVAAYGWPSVYRDGLSQSLVMLRLPMGFFIVPAYAARWLALPPESVTGVWLGLGASLLVLLVVSQHHTGKAWVVGGAILLAATEGLFNAPQDTLAGWIAVMLMRRTATSPGLTGVAGVVMVAVGLWSPAVAVGLLPVLMIIHWHRPGWRKWFSWGNLAVAPVAGGITALFLFGSGAGILENLRAWAFVTPTVAFTSLLVSQWLADYPHRGQRVAITLITVVAVGVLPLNHLWRAVHLPAWPVERTTNAALASQGDPAIITALESVQRWRLFRSDNDAMQQKPPGH